MPGSALSTLTLLAHLIFKQGKLISVPIRGEEAETKQSAANRQWPAVTWQIGQPGPSLFSHSSDVGSHESIQPCPQSTNGYGLFTQYTGHGDQKACTPQHKREILIEI